jgi:hypothetical protein
MPGECVRLGECTDDATVGRDAECVRRSRWEYPTSLVGIKMRYGPHATSNDRAPAPARPAHPSTSHRPVKRGPPSTKTALPADHA